MKRLFVTLILTAALSFMLPAIALAALAQDQTPPQQVPVGNLFTWFTQDPPNYRDGILFLILGALGALATMYAAVGGVMPGTAGKDELDRRQRALDVARNLETTLQQKVDALNSLPALDPANENKLNRYREDLARAQDRSDGLEKQLNSEKWRQFIIACIFYLPLGGGFAAALAQDLVQALIIGAGWPTVWASYQLTNQVTKLNQNIADVEKENTLLREQGAQGPAPRAFIS
jgi:hypothetical protein